MVLINLYLQSVIHQHGVKEIGLKYADGNWAWLESGKRYAVTLNYKILNNNGNGSDTQHLPQIAIGYDDNGSTTSKGAFYVAAVKNHKRADKGNSYYLNAEIAVEKDKPLRIGLSGAWQFQINSILLQEINADAEIRLPSYTVTTANIKPSL